MYAALRVVVGVTSAVASVFGTCVTARRLYVVLQTKLKRKIDAMGDRLGRDSTSAKLLRICSHLAFPCATLGAAWLIAGNPAAFRAAVPSVFSHYGATIADALPLRPQDMSEAFAFGSAWQQLQSGKADEALATAAAAASKYRKTGVSAAQLERTSETVKATSPVESLFRRATAAFLITNAVWLASVLGLSATLGPMINLGFRSMEIDLWQCIKSAALFCRPFLIPLVEPALYTSVVFTFVESSRYCGTDTMAGPMTWLTGVALFTVAWGYTTFLNSNGSGNVQLFASLTTGLIGLTTAPGAILHQSSFLGYVAVGALTAAFGFTSFSSGLCAMIGFRDRDALQRSAVACGLLSALNFLIRFCATQGILSRSFLASYYGPFESAISVIGNSVFLLALDINCLRRRNAFRSVVVYLSSVSAVTVLGSLLELPGARNVGLVHVGSFFFTMYCNLAHHCRSKESFIFWFFFIWVLIYGIGTVLSNKPQLITAIVSGGLRT